MRSRRSSDPIIRWGEGCPISISHPTECLALGLNASPWAWSVGPTQWTATDPTNETMLPLGPRMHDI